MRQSPGRDHTRHREKRGPARAGQRISNALLLLRAMHENLQSHYDGFETSGGDDRYFLANRLLRDIARYTQLKAEVFYPAVRQQAERQGHRQAEGCIREALREHRAMASRMTRLHEVTQDDVFLRGVVDLMQQVRNHVEREEREFFGMAEALLGEGGLVRLSRTLQQRNEELEYKIAV